MSHIAEVMPLLLNQHNNINANFHNKNKSNFSFDCFNKMAFLISKSLETGVLIVVEGVCFDFSGAMTSLVFVVTPDVDTPLDGETLS